MRTKGKAKPAQRIHTDENADQQPGLVVNDRKFPAGTVFFSHTNQPTVLFHEPVMIRTSQPNRLRDDNTQ